MGILTVPAGTVKPDCPFRGRDIAIALPDRPVFTPCPVPFLIVIVRSSRGKKGMENDQVEAAARRESGSSYLLA
jgi:hypothetical protein